MQIYDLIKKTDRLRQVTELIEQKKQSLDYLKYFIEENMIFCEWQPNSDMWTLSIDGEDWYFENVESEEYYDPTKLYFQSDMYVIDCLAEELEAHDVQSKDLVKYFIKHQ